MGDVRGDGGCGDGAAADGDDDDPDRAASEGRELLSCSDGAVVAAVEAVHVVLAVRLRSD